MPITDYLTSITEKLEKHDSLLQTLSEATLSALKTIDAKFSRQRLLNLLLFLWPLILLIMCKYIF